MKNQIQIKTKQKQKKQLTNNTNKLGLHYKRK